MTEPLKLKYAIAGIEILRGKLPVALIRVLGIGSLLLSCILLSPIASAQITDFRAEVIDREFIRLNIMMADEDAANLVIRRRRYSIHEMAVRIGDGKAIPALRYDDGVVIHTGPLRKTENGFFVFEDRNVTPYEKYSYWVGIKDEESYLGPIYLKVKHPDVWWSQERIDTALDFLAETYPQRVKIVELGKTNQGTSLRAIVIGKTDNAISFTGNIHAGEYGASYIIEAARMLLENDQSLFDKAGFIAIPVVNVDKRRSFVNGWPIYTRKTLSAETAEKIKGGFPPMASIVSVFWRGGVDLNRNLSKFWEIVDNRSYGTDTSKASSSTYRGPHSFSEPETRAIRELFARYQPMVHIDLHEARGGLHITDDDNEAYMAKAMSFVAPFRKGFYYDNPDLQSDLHVVPTQPGKWPGSVMHYGYSLGIPTFTSETHDGLPEELHSRFHDTATQTPEDMKNL